MVDCPKPALKKRRHPDAAIDRRESAKVRKRSEGRCEVRERLVELLERISTFRCAKRAEHVMHLIGGNGKRGRGISALAEHKLHGCADHHREIDGDIGGKKLKRIGGLVPLWTDVYERVT